MRPRLASVRTTPAHPRFRQAILLFLLALLARGGWGTYRLATAADPQALEFPDERQYWLMACSLRSGRGLRDEMGFQATRMPVYPGLLAPCTTVGQGVVIAKGVQWVTGSLAAPLAFCLAGLWFDRRVSGLAGLLVALDPFLVFFSSLLLTETIFIVALMGLWVAAGPLGGIVAARVSRIRWVVVGVLGGATVYGREAGLGLVVCLLGWLICRRPTRERIWGVGSALLIVVVMLFPWAARNQSVLGRWVWLTTRGGISLYDGVGPQADGSSRLQGVQQSDETIGLTEVAWNSHFMRLSLRSIREDPGRICRLALIKLGRMWNPVPNVGAYRSFAVSFLSAAWMVGILGFAVVGALHVTKHRGADGNWMVLGFLLLPAAYLSLLHCFFVGSVRYRLPAMPLLEVLAAAGLAKAWAKVAGRLNPHG